MLSDLADTLSYRSGNTTRVLDPRMALRRLEKQAADQRVHSTSLNLVGEFAIGEIANRFIIENIMDTKFTGMTERKL